MVRLLLLALLLLNTTGVVLAQSPFITSFKKTVGVEIFNPLLVPTVVEVPFSEPIVGRVQFAVLEVESNTFVANSFFSDTTNFLTPVSVFNVDGLVQSELTDNNFLTSSYFPLNNDDRTLTALTINSEVPVTSSYLTFNLAPNVAWPTSVKITAIDTISGSDTVVATKAFTGVRVPFPQTTASQWLIEIVHSQPLRLNELTLQQDFVTQNTDQYIRFLAQPGRSYKVYFDSDREVSLPRTEAPDLNSNNGVLRLPIGVVFENLNFIEADSDNDGVTDRLDNCVSVSNSDQIDVDGNGRGDACDDFDRDGLINSADNCLNAPNRDQADEDGDGIGNACDTEESRLTEKYAWIPWVGLGGAGLAILLMFMVVSKREEAVTEEAVTREGEIKD